MCEQPLGEFNCPTRRKVIAYPTLGPWSEGGAHANFGPTTAQVRSDYGGNGGAGHPPELAPAFPVRNDDGERYNVGPDSYAAIPGYADLWIPEDDASCQGFTGVIYQRSWLQEKDIPDGLSRTFLIGEKYLTPDNYFNGCDPADSGPMLQGYDWDIIRLGNSYWPPYRDRPGVLTSWNFGRRTPQRSTCCFATARRMRITYSIDIPTYSRLACRKDKQPVDSAAAGF